MSRRPLRSARRSCLPDLKLSDDGLYYWDGAQWVTTLSHDGRSRWNGTAWVPVGVAPPPAQFQLPRKAREATGWTKALQYTVAGWYLLQAIYGLAVPFVMSGPLTVYVNEAMQRSAELNPDTPPPPMDLISTVISWSLAFGAVVAIAISTVAIVGALKRWTWVYYTVLVLLGFQTVTFPFTLLSAVSTSALSPVRLPVELTIASVAFGIPGIALFAWMLVAAIKRGPWGMRRAA